MNTFVNYSVLTLNPKNLDLSNYRPVYAPKDLLEVLLSLKGPMRQEDEYSLKKLWTPTKLSALIFVTFSILALM